MSVHSGACGGVLRLPLASAAGCRRGTGCKFSRRALRSWHPPSINTIIAALRPAYPIKRLRVRQRTQASQGVGKQKSLRPCAIGGERACKGRVGEDGSPLRPCSSSGEVHGETLEIVERAVVEGAFVSSPQDHAGRAARLQRFAPAGRAQAPAVAGPQAGKAELGHRRRKIIAARIWKTRETRRS